MWFPDKNSLAEASPATQFLTLKWNEFFDEFTPDSFQPRLCQLPTLVNEIESAARDVVADPRYSTHLKKLRAELSQKLLGYVEKKITSDHHRYHLNQIVTNEDPKKIRDHANFLLESGYADAFEESLLKQSDCIVDLLSNPAALKKRESELWLGGLATLALHKGYLKLDDPLEFNNELLGRSAGEILQEIRELLSYQ